MEKAVDFFFELGQLKRVKRSGWWLVGIKDPESVAEHSFRAAAIGYFLAKKEGADADKVMRMCLFNDLHEARLNDLHKVGHRYIDFPAAEKKAFSEQVESLPAELAEGIRGILDELHADNTKDGIVARDADYLECAFQAKEYIDMGYNDAHDWINNIRKNLRTASAKKMLVDLEKTSSNNWWHGLKNAKR
ncbi:HD domain-containing protein [Candidatus Woesearchaeota archaeon]|nr:HD domain-containing protein [Candidatus Woesearchaeota archaeon]